MVLLLLHIVDDMQYGDLAWLTLERFMHYGHMNKPLLPFIDRAILKV